MALLRSFAHRPTSLTAWMVNRLLNGAQDAAERTTYVAAFDRAREDPATDSATRAEIEHYLERNS